MSTNAVINLKTDSQLKKSATEAAAKLGISISAVLNNELRRFAAEQSVIFEVPEVPNTPTAAQLASSNKQIASGNYHKFTSNKESLDFLANTLK